MSWLIALKDNPADSQVFYDGQLVEGVTEVRVSQTAKDTLRVSLVLVGKDIDVTLVSERPQLVNIFCQHCNKTHNHQCYTE